MAEQPAHTSCSSPGSPTTSAYEGFLKVIHAPLLPKPFKVGALRRAIKRILQPRLILTLSVTPTQHSLPARARRRPHSPRRA